METVPTDPIRPTIPPALALWSLAGVLRRARPTLQRIAWRAGEVQIRAASGQIRGQDVADLADQVQSLALTLISIDTVAALLPPAPVPPPPAPEPPPGLIQRIRRAWRVLTGVE